MSDAHDPDHYKVGGIESIDVIHAKLSIHGFQGFCAGHVMKYVHRMGHKGSSISDARKAQTYLGWLVKSMESVARKEWVIAATDDEDYPWSVVDSTDNEVEYDRYSTWGRADFEARSLNLKKEERDRQ